MGEQTGKTEEEEGLFRLIISLFVNLFYECVCTSLCTTVVHNTARKHF